MAKKASLEYFRAMGLLPFQAKFALDFLESKEKRHWELFSPPGTGKTRLGVALVVSEIESAPGERILILAPAATIALWQSQLSSSLPAAAACKPLVIDRKTYLELESSVPVGHTAWPTPTIIIMSIDLAKRDDMSIKLRDVTWDLAIFDEAHLLVGKRRELFDQLTKSGTVRRSLSLTSSSLKPLGDESMYFTYKDVVDWDGRPLFASLKRELTTIYYDRTRQEYDLLQNLQEFAERLVSYGPRLGLQARIILQGASSNIYTIEDMLHRLQDTWRPMRNKVAHNISWADEDGEKFQRLFGMASEEPEIVDEFSRNMTIQPQEFIDLYRNLEMVLEKFEGISSDSKLEAMISHLNNYWGGQDSVYLCLWCVFASTVEYLSSNLQDMNRPIFSLTGSLGLPERKERLQAFRERGGILIASAASMEGNALEYVGECINYDLPHSPVWFEQRWGQFLRFGRRDDFRMVILRDRARALRWEEGLLDELEKNISAEQNFLE